MFGNTIGKSDCGAKNCGKWEQIIDGIRKGGDGGSKETSGRGEAVNNEWEARGEEGGEEEI